jgi:hypothetical protein
VFAMLQRAIHKREKNVSASWIFCPGYLEKETKRETQEEPNAEQQSTASGAQPHGRSGIIVGRIRADCRLERRYTQSS